LGQNDFKKVLAYSTISQLGFMFVGVGTGNFAGGIFHLFTHAFSRLAFSSVRAQSCTPWPARATSRVWAAWPAGCRGRLGCFGFAGWPSAGCRSSLASFPKTPSWQALSPRKCLARDYTGSGQPWARDCWPLHWARLSTCRGSTIWFSPANAGLTCASRFRESPIEMVGRWVVLGLGVLLAGMLGGAMGRGKAAWRCDRGMAGAPVGPHLDVGSASNGGSWQRRP